MRRALHQEAIEREEDEKDTHDYLDSCEPVISAWRFLRTPLKA